MSKYKNKKCNYTFQHKRYDFDSYAERDYFIKLAHKAKAFEVDSLKLQPKYIIANAYKIDTNKTKSGKSKVGELKYTPDFEHIENGKKVVTEVKGMITKDYRMRLKMFLAIAHKRYGVDTFIEVIKGIETHYDCTSVKEIA